MRLPPIFFLILLEKICKILTSYDADSKEYIAVQVLYQRWKEEAEEAMEE